jgi:hypothetical protein
MLCSRLLEEVHQFWNLPVRHFGGAPWVREEEVAIATLSTPESFQESSSLTDGATRGAGSWIIASAMEQGVETVQQVVKSKRNGRWEGKSEK